MSSDIFLCPSSVTRISSSILIPVPDNDLLKSEYFDLEEKYNPGYTVNIIPGFNLISDLLIE